MVLSYVDIIEFVRRSWDLHKEGNTEEALILLEQGLAKTADGYLAYNYGCILASNERWEEARAKFLYAMANLPLVEYRAKAIAQEQRVRTKVSCFSEELKPEYYLADVHIYGLFDKYNHKINLTRGEENEAICILSAPNGYGKTALLRIVKAFFDADFSAFVRIFFREALFIFSDGRVVSVKQESKGKTILVELKEANGSCACSQYINLDKKARTQNVIEVVSRYLPQFVRISEQLWWDSKRGTIVDFEFICRHYGIQLYKTMMKEIHMPEQWLKDRISAQSILFINTERLFRRRGEMGTRAVTNFLDNSAVYSIAVEEDARLMNDFLMLAQEKSNLIIHSKRDLYVNEILTMPNQIPCSEKELKRRIKKIGRTKKVLEKIGFTFDFPLEIPLIADFNEFNKRALHLFLSNEEAALEPLEEFARDVYILKDLVNARLLGKKLKVSPQYGFQMIDEDTGKAIGLRNLSSGEQNQIVLFFELLFNTDSNTIVLIDEPELSLHIAWQRAFLPDLIKVSQRKGFYSIVATHSPAIVNDRWDLNQDLTGDGEDYATDKT